MNGRRGLLLLLSVFLFSAIFSPDASEARPRILRPGTKPWAYMGAIGPMIGVTNYKTSFLFHNTIGFHLFERSSGPALGGDFDFSFASEFFTMTLGPRFWYDIPIARMSLYVSPFARLAYTLAVLGNSAAHFFNISFGARFKVILNNSLLLSFQPLAINMYLGGGGPFSGFIFSLGISLLFGVGVTF